MRGYSDADWVRQRDIRGLMFMMRRTMYGKKGICLLICCLLLTGCSGMPEGTGGQKVREIPSASKDSVSSVSTVSAASSGNAAGADNTEEEAVSGNEEMTAGRELTRQEIESLNQQLSEDDNGFFVSSYCRPEEIEWEEVLYNGAGIGAELSEEEMKRVVKDNGGNPDTGLTAVRLSEVKDFVEEKTGTSYEDARHPLRWNSLEEEENEENEDSLYYFFHGDTNAIPVSIEAGTAEEGESDAPVYRLYYYHGYTWDTEEKPEADYVMTVSIRDGGWTYLSNLPIRMPEPKELLTISYFRDEEEAKKDADLTAGMETFDSDQPETWFWARITSNEDDLELRIDRALSEGDLAEEMLTKGVFVPGAEQYSGVLSEGETLVINVNVQEVPTIRLTARSGEFLGDYRFGQELWLHRESEDGTPEPAYVMGYAEKENTASPQNQDDFVEMLTGDWVYYDGEGKEVSAWIRYEDYRTVWVHTAERTYQLWVKDFKRMSKGGGEAPDTLVMDTYDSKTLKHLPKEDTSFTEGEYGSYLAEVRKEGNERILKLSQVDNGDGILSYVLPDAEEDRSFEFYGCR